MDAKEYLLQIGQISGSIKRRKKELNKIRAAGVGMRSANFRKEKVQESGKLSKAEDMAERRTDLQQEINDEIKRLTEIRHSIITDINSLSREEYSEILFLIYVEGKSLKDAALEMNYSYNYACTLHGIALKEFKRKYMQRKGHNKS